MLAWRSFAEQSRDLVTLKIKLILSIFFSALIGGIYSNIGYGQSSIQNRSGLFFFIAILINTAFTSFSAVLNTFPKEKTIVWRERSGRAYDTVSYFVSKVFHHDILMPTHSLTHSLTHSPAKVLVEIPLNIVPAIVYACILYWIVGLNADRFGYFILILMLHVVVTISLGLFISSFAPNVDAANAMGVPFLIIGIIFGGFYIDVKSLPIVANWIPYISFIRWTFQALLINEFKGLEFDCDIQPANACILTGEAYLEKVAFDGHTTAYAVFGMGMLLLCYLTMTFTSLVVNGLKFTHLNWTGAFYSKTIASSHTTRDTTVHAEGVELTEVTSKTETV
jgi:ATP-binding cassette subfamily G (WHITE) protein 2